MASQVGICNRALQILGAARITAIDEDSRNARSCNNAYSSVLDSELRAHNWNFAITRTSIAADSDTPVGEDFDYQYSLPSDPYCLKILFPTLYASDWVVEGRKILSNDTAPLYLRYIARITDPNQYDVNFIESFAAKMAEAMTEQITQSNTKKADAKDTYDKAIKLARKANAFERLPQQPVEDSWISARR